MNTLTVIKSLLTIYLLVCTAIYVFQRSMIYHPAEATDHIFDVLKINNQNHTVETIMTKQVTGDVIIYFGGNAENVAYSATDFNQQFPDHNTYLMKYRGYAGATGKPTEEALYSDALALYDHIKQKSTHNINVIGRSLGTGVATYVATQRDVDKLILITPYDSILNIAKSKFPVFPVKWMLKDQYDSKARAPNIQSPTLVIIATEDQIIPRSHTESLIKSMPKHHLTTTVIQAGHNDLDLMPEYFSSLKQFLDAKE